jgi:hypothetical protein
MNASTEISPDDVWVVVVGADAWPLLLGKVAAARRILRTGLNIAGFAATGAIAMAGSASLGSIVITRPAEAGEMACTPADAGAGAGAAGAGTRECNTGAGRNKNAGIGRVTGTGAALKTAAGSGMKVCTGGGGGDAGLAGRRVTTRLRANTTAVMYAGKFPLDGSFPSLNCTVGSEKRQKRAANKSGLNQGRTKATLQNSNDRESIVELPEVVPKMFLSCGGAWLTRFGMSAAAMEKFGQAG